MIEFLYISFTLAFALFVFSRDEVTKLRLRGDRGTSVAQEFPAKPANTKDVQKPSNYATPRSDEVDKSKTESIYSENKSSIAEKLVKANEREARTIQTGYYIRATKAGRAHHSLPQGLTIDFGDEVNEEFQKRMMPTTRSNLPFKRGTSSTLH